jgi:hypothetical protein
MISARETTVACTATCSSVVLARVAETTTAVSDRIVVSFGGLDCAAARAGVAAIAAASTANGATDGR